MNPSLATSIDGTTTIRLRNRSRILQQLRSGDDFSCRELSLRTELSVPTVSTIVSGLAAQQLLEPVVRREIKSGRPGKTFRIARKTSHVMCVIVGTGTCSLVAISPNGGVLEETLHVFATPTSTDRLIHEISAGISAIQQRQQLRLLGLGLVVPGILDPQREGVQLAPNLAFLSGHKLRTPLSRTTDLPVVLLPSMEAHQLAESAFGPASCVDDFVVLNFAGGIGVSVCMEGEFLRGRFGTGIELGHTTFMPDGPRCGCDNRGCLEQFGSDETILRAGRDSLGRGASIQEIVSYCRAGELDLTTELHAATDALAVAVANSINLFSPQKVLLFGYFLSAADDLFERLRAAVERRALADLMADCELLPQVDAHRSQQLGASVAVVNELAGSVATGRP